MKRIYVSYRREDTSESYDRIVERIRGYFGSEATLRSDTAYTADGATISPAEYRAYVAGAMKSCAALLLIIGPRWLASDQPGDWNLSDLDDPVRIEIEGALRAGVPIVPAIVQRGRIPEASELPPSLRLLLEQDQERGRGHSRGKRESLLALVSRAGLQIRRDPDFGGDTQRLCEVIENLAGLEASSLERASGSINRVVRNVTLLAAVALSAHAAILAFFAYQSLIPLPPAFLIPSTWLPTVILTFLLDWGVYLLAGYVVSRRTGDTGLGVSAAVTAYVAGAAIEIALFSDIAWSQWAVLTAPTRMPGLLDGTPAWLINSSLLLMRPFALLFAVLAIGIPLGLGMSFALGTLGGILGARVTEIITALQRERERRALLQNTPSARERWRAALRRTPAETAQQIRRRATPAGKVFISYRRDDSAVMCGSIYDRLTAVFGLDTVFKDVDMIPVGVNFANFIDSTLRQCVAQVVVIGPRWVSIASAQGARRLDDPTDFVRLEVESALKAGLTIIPALVQGATMPTADELPESLRPLSGLTPVRVRYAPAFDDDMRALGVALAPVIWPAPGRLSALKRVASLRAGRGAAQVAAYFWLALLLAYGVALGVEITSALASWDTPSRDAAALTVAGVAPVVLTALTLLSGAHLGFHTGRVGRAFWLAWRAAIIACVSATLTAQIRGAALFPSLVDAVGNVNYRSVATVTLLAGVIIALGPSLLAALLGAAGASFLRRRVDRVELLSRGPTTLQLLYRDEDASAASNLTAGLVAYFGRRVLPLRRMRLHNQTLQPNIAVRLGAIASERLRSALRAPALDPDIIRRSADARLLAGALKRSAAALVLVGPGWLADGRIVEEMEDPTNPLRARIEAALATGRPIIPVLLTDATMPSPDQLPPGMREFAMLNAAWIRKEPDFPGDMRRLARVIERITRIHKAQRWTESGLPLEGGGLLATLILIALDGLIGWQVLRGFDHYIIGNLLLLGGALILMDLLIYGLTGGLVTRASGKRGNGALAALLGAGLAMLVSAAAFRYASGDFGAQWSARAASLAGVPAITQTALDAIALYLVARIPFQTLGAAAASALGAFYGRIAYRARERAIQERLLYQMARTATSADPLAELSARSARASGGPAPAPVAAVLPPAPITELHTTPAPATPSAPDEPALVAASTDHASDAALLPVAEPDTEAIRRESLLTEIRSVRLASRKRARIRLGAIAGVAAALLIVVSMIGRQVYASQLISVGVEAAQAHATATTLERQTEVATYTQYVAPAPGQTCDTGQGAWALSDPLSVNISCTNGSAYVDMVNDNGYHVATQQLTLKAPFTRQYTLASDVALLNSSSCAGIVSNGSPDSGDSAIAFEICANGTWRVIYYLFITADLSPGDLPADGLTLASGRLKLSKINHLAAAISTNTGLFTVNGRAVATITDSRFSQPTTFVGICVDWYGSHGFDSGAAFTNFIYIPAGF